MSVFYNFQIAPVSNTVTTLEDVAKFIANLRDKNFVEKEFMILSGNKEDIINIDVFDVDARLLQKSSLNIVSNPQGILSLNINDNYAFRLYISNNCEMLSSLQVFNSGEEDEKISLFLILLSESTNYESRNENEETEQYEEINISNINSFIKNTGRGGNTLYGLQENQNDYEAFFNEIELLYGNYILHSYYD